MSLVEIMTAMGVMAVVTGVSLQLGQELQRIAMGQQERVRLDAEVYASVREWKKDVFATLPGMEFWEEEINEKKWLGLVVEELREGGKKREKMADSFYTLVLVEWRWNARSQELSCWKKRVTKDFSEVMNNKENGGEEVMIRNGRELEKWVGEGRKYCVMKQTGVRDLCWEKELKEVRLWIEMVRASFSLDVRISRKW